MLVPILFDCGLADYALRKVTKTDKEMSAVALKFIPVQATMWLDMRIFVRYCVER